MNQNSSIPDQITKLALGSLSLLGIATSLYSTHHHYMVHLLGETKALCNINQAINCDRVALSPFSSIRGIPLSIFGLSFFIATFILAALYLRTRRLHYLQSYFLFALTGVLSCFGLAYLSIFRIKSLCLVCLAVYILCLLQLFFGFLNLRKIRSPFFSKASILTSWPALLWIGLTLLPYPSLKPKIETLFLSTNAATTAIELNIPNYLGSSTQTLLEDRKTLVPDALFGSPNAKVTLVEFMDYECPNCGIFAIVARSLKRDFGDKLLFVTKNFPMDKSCNPGPHMHDSACLAAYYAHCVSKQGKHYEFYNLALENQWDLAPEALRKWTRQLKLNEKEVESCVTAPETKAKILADITLGRSVGVAGTPTIFINGKSFIGPKNYLGYRRAVELLLRAPPSRDIAGK